MANCQRSEDESILGKLKADETIDSENQIIVQTQQKAFAQEFAAIRYNGKLATNA